MTITELQDALVYACLIDRDAIEDPDGYDEGSTLAQIDELHKMLPDDTALLRQALGALLLTQEGSELYACMPEELTLAACKDLLEIDTAINALRKRLGEKKGKQFLGMLFWRRCWK